MDWQALLLSAQLATVTHEACVRAAEAVLTAVELARSPVGPQAFSAGSAFAVQFVGLLAERWFFFAQANHTQNLYYQVTL